MCQDRPPAGRVYFVGAGPGAPDLITVRGARRIGAADVVVLPSAAVPAEAVRAHAAPAAQLVDCSRWGLEQLVQLYRGAAAQRQTVARVLPGDAALGSGVQREQDACLRLGLHVEIVPGVSALAAVVAAGGRELSAPVVLVTQQDQDRPGATAGLAAGLGGHGPDGVVAITASAARVDVLVAELRAAGHPADTPVVVGHKPGRPEELMLSTTLGELATTVKRHRLWLPALFLVGHTGRGRCGSHRPGAAPAPGAGSPRAAVAQESWLAPSPRAVAAAGRPVPAGRTAGQPAPDPWRRNPQSGYRRRRRTTQKVT
jgi:precorrin-4/cobalt-precorrin-4 C11-methyltransferase